MKPTLTPHRQTAKLTKKKKSRELLRNQTPQKTQDLISVEKKHRRVDSDAYLPEAVTNFRKLRQALSIKPYRPYSLMKKRQIASVKVIGSVSTESDYTKILENLIGQPSETSSFTNENLLKDLIDQSQQSREFYFAGASHKPSLTTTTSTSTINLLNQNQFLKRQCLRIIDRSKQDSKKHRQIRQNLNEQIEELRRVAEGLRRELGQAAEVRGVRLEEVVVGGGRKGSDSNRGKQEEEYVDYGIKIPRIKML